MMCRKYFNSEMGNDESPKASVDRRSRSRLKSTRSQRRGDSSRSVRSHANHHHQTRSGRSPSRRSRSRMCVQSRSRADHRRHSRANYRTRSRSSHRSLSPTSHRSRSRPVHSRAVQRGHTETSQMQRQQQQRSLRQVLTPDSVAREIQSSGQSRKLVPKFQGPYRIASVLGNDRYEIVDTPLTRKGNRKYTSVVAVDKLKPWLSYNRPDEIESSNDDNIDDSNSDC
ncbi:unnamed protein product, partial [Brenthis ino]